MKLTEYLEIMSYDIAFWMAGVRDPEFPLEQLGNVCTDVTAKLRAAAIISLLGKADSDTFFHNLIRSGRCRQKYLNRLREADRIGDHHQASGRVDPFLDAVAAEDFVTAREIVRLSPHEWLQGHEYEDDYCYAQIVHELISAQTSITRMNFLFTRYEAALQGAPDARLDVTRAIAERDQPAFETAFEALLARRTLQIDAEKARNKIEEPSVVAERQVYIEGLAMLRIAGRLGLPTQGDYLYCPSVARIAMQKPFPGE